MRYKNSLDFLIALAAGIIGAIVYGIVKLIAWLFS